MLVYGDQKEIADPRERLGLIEAKLVAIAATPAGLGRHAALVGVLIEAGRLLQGAADAGLAATDALNAFLYRFAMAVVRSWDSGFGEIGDLPAVPQLDPGLEVELRLPEGFAFYSVYPEAYIEAARRLRPTGLPCVIGIRSIGTSLGAVVAAALGATPPVTVRPFGDPFAREVELARELLDGQSHYVIVDEGPGQSGSSFGAVADWLEARGVPLDRIAFIPSHAGPPGPKASETHRRRWEKAQRAPADFGAGLPQLLREWVEPLVGRIEELRDISAGEWRRTVYEHEAQWPPVVAAWERRKFLARVGEQSYLIKFAGLGAIGERKLGMARALHAAGFVPEPMGLVHGFLIERWCGDARPLQPDDDPLEQVARYLGTRARLFPVPRDSGGTLDSLCAMGQRNASLALGDDTAARFGRWSGKLDQLSRRIVRVRTDNRLDRHEWVRDADGHLLKCDALDHHSAHDLIGCQDLAWDVAGANVEFGLGERAAQALITATERAAGRQIDRELLDFYLPAYCAFRLGQAVLGSEMCALDPPERERLDEATSRYARQLHIFLKVPAHDSARILDQ
jgi:hypothetical protein